MKKRMISGCLAAVLTLCMLLSATCFAETDTDEPVLDGSKLTGDEESIGYDTKITRGQYLMAGYSKVVRLGPEKVYVGGVTIATQDVERVMIGVIVERAREEDTSWHYYDGWIEERSNTDRINSTKMMEVEGDYYYRVRCTHSANDDVSSSFTDGVYIEEDSLFPGLGI